MSATGPPLPDRYQIKSQLGAGNFGHVYLCWDDALQVDVAIKVLDERRAEDPAVRNRFLNEARLLRSARTEWFVPVHDYGVLETDQPYLVMSVADRGTLETRIGPVRNPEDPGFQRLLGQLTEAVSAARNMGVVHRDIKPSNILVKASGHAGNVEGSSLLAADESIWLGDFGLVIDAEDGSRAGTPRYAAPEQLTPGAPVDHRADVYATAITLTELLTGKAFTADQLAQHELSHLSPSNRAGLARGAHPVVSRRWQSVESLAHALATGDLREELKTRAEGLADTETGTRRNNHKLVGVGLMASAACAVVAVVLFSLRGSDADVATVPTGSATSSETVQPLREDDSSESDETTGDATSAPTANRDAGQPWPEPVDVSVPVEPVSVAMEEMLLTDPARAAYGANGDLFVTDGSAHAIWRLSPDGSVALVAGRNGPGYSGDGGPALEAQLQQPAGIIGDGEGGLLFVERRNRTIRRIDADGTISTVYGDPTDTTLGDPVDLALTEDGTLLIADFALNQIAAYSPDGTFDVVAGTGVAGFSGDGGPATSARFSGAAGVTVMPDGSYLISDYFNNRVRRVAVDGTIETIIGNGSNLTVITDGPATATPFPLPTAAVLVGDEVVVLSEEGQAIARLDASGALEVLVQNGGFDAFGDDRLTRPSGLIWTGDEFIVVDVGSNRVHRVDADGSVRTIAGTGPIGGRGDSRSGAQVSIETPRRIDVNSFGQIAAVQFGDIVRLLTPEGQASTYVSGGTGRSEEGTLAGEAKLALPFDIAFTSDNGMVLAELANNRVVRISNNEQNITTLTLVAGTGVAGATDGDGNARSAQLNRPIAVEVGPDDEIYIADLSRILRIDPDGSLEVLDERVGATDPTTFSLAASGQRLYVADVSSGTVRTFDLTTRSFLDDQTFRVEPGDGVPVELLVDGRDLYVATQGHRVVRFDLDDPDGDPVPVAGTGVAGFSGDGGPADAAQLSSPTGLAIDKQDRLVIADFDNHRIRVVSDGIISTLAGGLGGLPNR